jgi:hypothetical protein
MDLTTFILARVEEDEAAAHAASVWSVRVDPPEYWREVPGPPAEWESSPYTHDEGRVERVNGSPDTVLDVVVYDEGSPSDAEARHIARQDPARVLAQCEAVRRIVETHRGWHVCPNAGNDGYTDYGDGSGDEWEPICPTLLALAQPYADHPDFDPAWSVVTVALESGARIPIPMDPGK